MIFGKNPSLALGMTLNDPKGEWNKNVAYWTIGKRLRKAFEGRVVVSATKATAEKNPELLELLRQQGIKVVIEESGRFSKNNVENNHLQALHEVSNLGSQWVMYGDFDRVCVDSVVKSGISRLAVFLTEFLDRQESRDTRLVVVGRKVNEFGLTERDSFFRYKTERPILNVLNKIVGFEIDPLTSYIVVRNNHARKIIEGSNSLSEMDYPATKWVLQTVEQGLKIASFNSSLVGTIEKPGFLDIEQMRRRIVEDEQNESDDVQRGRHTQEAKLALDNLESEVFDEKSMLSLAYYLPNPFTPNLEVGMRGNIERGKKILNFIEDECDSGRLDNVLEHERKAGIKRGIEKGRSELDFVRDRLEGNIMSNGKLALYTFLLEIGMYVEGGHRRDLNFLLRRSEKIS